jgi:DNA-binding MarR family transcriptional regulator
VTEEGAEAARAMRRSITRVQQRILAPLEPDEQAQLLALLDRLVAGHGEQEAGPDR